MEKWRGEEEGDWEERLGRGKGNEIFESRKLSSPMYSIHLIAHVLLLTNLPRLYFRLLLTVSVDVKFMSTKLLNRFCSRKTVSRWDVHKGKRY